MSGIVYGVPASVVNLVQQGLLERAFHDGLFPALMYRNEALLEEWPANSGETLVMQRPGLLAPVTKPTAPGTDPTPQTITVEQWVANLLRFTGTIDTHIPTSAVASANLFLRNIHQLGLQAGMSLNRIPRNELFKAYLSGQTLTTAATAIGDTLVHVSALNGFTDVVNPATTSRPVAVSVSTPLAAKLGTESVLVVGFTPTDPTDPFGPGTVTLNAALAAVHASRSTLVSAAAPTVIRSGGAASIDGLTGPSQFFTLQDAITACNKLRMANVMPHQDGFYHAHISPDSNTQIFQDPAWQRLNQSLPDGAVYQTGFIGTISGIMFYTNNESPTALNSGTLVSTAGSALYGSDIGAEVVNATGVNVGRILITGRGALYEKYLDESAYITEAGVTGKIGEFSIVNQGLAVTTDRIKLILRSPQNRLQDQVAASWSCSTSFTPPSDISSGGPQRFKRAVIIEHAT
jgi:hypothetical protein